MDKATYHHGNLREACLRIAFDIIVEDGLEDLSLAAVARRAGVSAPALYRHFGSRDDLVSAVQDQLLDDLRSRSSIEYDKHDAGSIEALCAMANTYVQMFAGDPNLLGLMERKSETLSPRRLDSFRVVRTAALDFLARYPGVTASEDEIAQSLWSIPHGVSHLFATGMFQALFEDVDPAKIARRTLASYLLGLLSDPAKAG